MNDKDFDKCLDVIRERKLRRSREGVRNDAEVTVKVSKEGESWL